MNGEKLTAQEKIGDWFKQNMFLLGVGIICLGYILRGYVKIEETGDSLLEIIASGAISFIVGFLICKLLQLQGILKGEMADSVKTTNKLYASTLEKISPISHLLDDYCEKKNDETYKRLQRKIIASARIKYEDFLENNIDETKLDKDQIIKLRKARKIKITPLSAAALTTDNNKDEDPYNFGMTVAQFLRRSDAKKVLTKLLFAVVFGYFGVSFVFGASLASLIWTSIQVSIFLVMGMLDYLKSFLFMTGPNRQRTLRKNNELEVFINDMKAQGKYNPQVKTENPQEDIKCTTNF